MNAPVVLTLTGAEFMLAEPEPCPEFPAAFAESRTLRELADEQREFLATVSDDLAREFRKEDRAIHS